MAHMVTLGGDRLGSGNKNKIALHNYERSTHDLSQKFTSSMQCGTLYPFLCIPAMRGDKFEINLNADARTIPTKGPLFGSFKMQVDLFQCDVRLYQAILHNNPLAIGLKMNQVMFPILSIEDGQKGHAFANSCLMKYLGLSGAFYDENGTSETRNRREFNAIPALAYYEIFKTYYANKQEENAYTIGTQLQIGNLANYEATTITSETTGNTVEMPFNSITPTRPKVSIFTNALPITITLAPDAEPYGDIENLVYFTLYNNTPQIVKTYSFKELIEKGDMIKTGFNTYKLNKISELPSNNTYTGYYIGYMDGKSTYQTSQRTLIPFNLANIDDMRLKLLSHHQLGTAFEIYNDQEHEAGGDWGSNSGTDQTGLPYIRLVDVYGSQQDSTLKSLNCEPLNGLVVKTYQSDLFNNWVNTEWIDGENGIANVTAISTSDGSFTIDSLNFAEKLYNMLNRIAVSDGSYEGWQDAVYTETPKRHIESPIYLGGMSSEIVFEEIVQTSQGDSKNPLGTLGGKGKLLKRKGGHVVVKTNEAAFIIGIVSLTPRINYSQGNEFYLTDLMSMDDFHKPALDGIGFQNLIGERLAWWDAHLTSQGIQRTTVGKVPAWIEYMTAVDKTYGDFAETGGRGFMALNREYEQNAEHRIKDATTYIDPRKYNYAFAVSDIDAQNFWVQVYSDIKARRLMSAKQIPNI